MSKKSQLLFSQRKGIKPLKTALQIDSMDEDLRNTLWSRFYELYLRGQGAIDEDPADYSFYYSLWHKFFKKPVDSLSRYRSESNKVIKDYFLSCEWFEAYDLLEFVVNSDLQTDETRNELIRSCNVILEQELSAYRFVGGRITQITSMEEISELEEALSHDFLKPVNIHLKTALGLLSDKKNPDYRNSIKESISAVESLSKLITKKATASLGDALKTIEKNVELHGALKSAFNKLYGYTSDAEGIRHSLMDKSDLNFEDAKFMLVACSTFINYLIQKSIKSGIELS